jgi:tetratricopeptide (TPR) repeat protein
LAFELSYNDLTAAQQEVFLAFGFLAPGGAGCASVGWMIGTDGCSLDVEDALDELEVRSLVESTSAQRYRTHLLLREFAAVKASEARRETFTQRQRDLLEAIAALEAKLTTLQFEGAGLCFLNDHWDQGVWLTTKTSLDDATYNSMTQVLTEYLLTTGRASSAVDFLRLALVKAQATQGKSAEGAIYGNLGNAYDSLGQAEQAIECYQQTLAISRGIGDRRGEGNTLGNLGNAYRSLGQVQQAIKYCQEFLDVSREIGDRRGEGNALGNLGNAYYFLGQVQQAIEYYQQALDISREIGDRRGEGNRLSNLGNAYYSLDEVQRAIEYYQQALAVSREIGDRQGEGNRLGNLGIAYYSLDEVQQAIEYYQQALAISREIGDRQGEGNWLGNLSNAYYSLDQVQKAIEYCQKSLDVSREIGDRQGEGSALSNLGDAYFSLGQVQQAIACWVLAFVIFRDSESPHQQTVLEGLAEMRSSTKEFKKVLFSLFPGGDAVLIEATGQDYCFYRNAPSDLPEQILNALDQQ